MQVLLKKFISSFQKAIAVEMEAMRQRNKRYKLKGEVQLDDAYPGGEKPGKRGR